MRGLRLRSTSPSAAATAPGALAVSAAADRRIPRERSGAGTVRAARPAASPWTTAPLARTGTIVTSQPCRPSSSISGTRNGSVAPYGKRAVT